MIEPNDIEQMLYLFGLDFEKSTSIEEVDIFNIPMFGVKILYASTEKGEKTKLFNDAEKIFPGWRTVCIGTGGNFEEAKVEIVWELMAGGYMRHLRIERPNTFRRLISLNGWDRKIIEKRIELYGDDSKYNYLKAINEQALGVSAGYILSLDPGFFDFLVE